MKVTHRDAADFTPHPLGWHGFQVLTCEETESTFKGKVSERYKWECMSRVKREDGKQFIMSVWTGREMVNDERCKLKQLVEACGLDAEEFEDTDELMGIWFAGKCAAGVEEKTKGFVNIVAFDTIDRVKVAKPAAGKKKAQSAEFNDPFADE